MQVFCIGCIFNSSSCSETDRKITKTTAMIFSSKRLVFTSFKMHETSSLLHLLEFKRLPSFTIKENRDVVRRLYVYMLIPRRKETSLNEIKSTSNTEHLLQQQGGFKDSMTSILETFISIHVAGYFNTALGCTGRGNQPVTINRDP